MTTTETSDWVVCWMPFSGPAGTVTRGEKLPADSPLVAQGRLYFVPADTPQREWPSVVDQLVEANDKRQRDTEREFAERAAQNRVKLTAPRTVKCVHDFVATVDGHPATIIRGSVVLASHELALDHPEAWR